MYFMIQSPGSLQPRMTQIWNNIYYVEITSEIIYLLRDVKDITRQFPSWMSPRRWTRKRFLKKRINLSNGANFEYNCTANDVGVDTVPTANSGTFYAVGTGYYSSAVLNAIRLH